MSADVSYVDKYITYASQTQKVWLPNLWASDGCCKSCLYCLATPLYPHLFQLSELLAYAKNTCELDHLYAMLGAEQLPSWEERGDLLFRILCLSGSICRAKCVRELQ